MRQMSTDRSVMDYRVRVGVEASDEPVDGEIWVREEDLEWEVEAADTRLVTDVSDAGAARRDVVFNQLRDKLGDEGVRLRTCGTCAFFRAAPDGEDDENGWLGYCTKEHPENPESVPDQVALLAPDCHEFEYREGSAHRIDITELRQAGLNTPADVDATAPMPQQDEQETGLFGFVKRLFNIGGTQEEYVRTGVIERPGGQPCACCGTRMTNRASIANMSESGEERILSVWRCPHCHGNYLDDWFEAYVGSRARDAERLYVVPPAVTNVAVEMVAKCPRPDTKGCTCVANQWFDKWGDGLHGVGRRAKHRESVVSL